ncbi:MAG: hypothetical protein QXD05_00275 [Candidatus Pacearchaeota archaeon]
MPKSDGYFKPGNKAAAVNKGKKKRRTIIREKIRDWAKAEKLVEENILEFLQSKSKKDRLYATKYFAEFIKPKKREHTGEISGNIKVNINYITDSDDKNNS